LLCFPVFFFLSPFGEGFHSNKRMKDKNSSLLHMAGGSLI
jgi:hypothetical protein